MKIMLGLMSVLCAIAVCTVLNLTSGVFIPLVIAWFLLQVFRPVIALGRKIRLPQILNTILVLAVFFGLCFLGVKFCTTQVVAFNQAFNRYYDKLSAVSKDMMVMLRIPEDVMSRFDWVNILGSSLRNISGLAFELSSKFVLMVVFLMFMLLEAPYLDKKIDHAFSGSNAVKIKKILATVSDQISRYLGTMTLISMATGFCAWIALRIFDVELAEGWAVLTFVLNFIPTVGSIIATIPPVLMAMFQFSPSYFRPIMVLLSLWAIQLTIGNIITPKVVGDRLDLSPVLILLSLLFWGMIWGIPGAILSVPIASIIKIVCENIPSLRSIAVMMGSGRETSAKEETV
ncbi:pheromone autoinducer 2 transporter [Synergistales bacterium]|nr:pheromone autoinducer 2 transporter [Synergistales bacterium]